MDKKALLVDGDKEFMYELNLEMKKMGFESYTTSRGKDILDIFDSLDFDLIIMDFNLSDIDGLILCREIRRISSIPIIVVTENDSIIDKVLALDSGADDYIVKPFNMLELKSRIKALFRRIELSCEQKEEERFKAGDFIINKVGRTIELNGKKINLTGKEFDIFYILATNPGKVFKREELLNLVWGEDYFGDGRTIDVHIRRIRRKIGKVKKNEEYIMTKWGVGYYFSSTGYR